MIASGEIDLPQGIATVDEESRVRGECCCDTSAGQCSRSRVAPVECAHADREGQIERCLAGEEGEVLALARPVVAAA